jgi:predicted AAA+ superfamily ATPase
LSAKAKYLASKFPVVAITGPRQSGKTTLARAVFSNYDYASLEDPVELARVLDDPKLFLIRKKGLIIDEAQRAPEIFSHIQVLVDRVNKPGRFILTGSRNIMLQKNLSQTLAGRVALLTLLPFSIEELSATRYAVRGVEEAMYQGFYPRIYDKKIKPLDWYPSYFNTYVERDVRDMKDIGNLAAFRKFTQMCAARIGQIVNLSSLANDCGITHNTAKAWLSVLEATYIIFLLQPHHKNFNKRLIKAPKLYFYDTGLACFLLRIENKKALQTHYLRGGIFESMVISEFVKYRLHRGLPSNLYFWRDKAGAEVDCIVETDNALIPIEIKSGTTAARDYFSGISYWKKLAGKSARKAYVIYAGQENSAWSEGELLGWRDMTDSLKRKS